MATNTAQVEAGLGSHHSAQRAQTRYKWQLALVHSIASPKQLQAQHKPQQTADHFSAPIKRRKPGTRGNLPWLEQWHPSKVFRTNIPGDQLHE